MAYTVAEKWPRGALQNGVREFVIYDASHCANGDLRLLIDGGTRSAYAWWRFCCACGKAGREENNMLGTILLLVLILMLLGAVPAWPYSRQWGYAPSGGIGLVLMVVLILVLLRHI